MKQVLVHNLVPGMTVGKDVYAENDLLLTPAGAKLTNHTISSLLLHSILSVYIKEEPVSEKREPVKKPNMQKSSLAFTETKEFQRFSKNFKNTTESLKGQINDVVTKNASFSPDLLLTQTSELFSQDMTTICLFDMLHHMRHYDDSTYVHCINVALICNVFGKWLELPQKEIEVLTLCGLLHDIGKLDIPDSIVKKAGKLTPDEYKVIQRHPYKGYLLLKDHAELDPRIAQAALLHHERCDGTGYPTGCSRNRITDFALIVSIADVYDAMTSERVYREALSPFKVIKILQDEGVQKYDTHYFLTFLHQIVNSYVNSDVLLSDGTKAHVIYINKMDLSRPVVKTASSIIDLSKERTLEIEAML
ncbi:MAG: HD-GYP domain-containing protein [bacterium]|nr:HD-GYP domain-containing protein [bacterium]